MTVRVGVTGATGSMGREVRALAAERDDVDLVFAASRSGDPDPADEFAALLDAREPHVVVDFTVPEASAEYVEACADAGVAAVVGTTGFDGQGESALDAASERVPVLHAANFSRGIQGLLDAVSSAVADLPGYDVELTETHHNRKRDAPSGTANAILDRIDEEREARSASRRTHGREGDAPREPGEIGVHARRAGGIHGEHEVLLAGNDEVLSLSHRAESRGVFAAGALDAAVRVAGHDPGRYEFAEVLEGGE